MTVHSNKKVYVSSEVRPWKLGRAEGLMFFIFASPLVSLMRKSSSILSLCPLPFLFSTIRLVGMGSSSFSSPIGSSKSSDYSPNGSSNSQPLKKREGWLFELVGVFGRNFLKLSLFL